MPPFKSGLLKRKSSSAENKSSAVKSETDDESSLPGHEELLRGELDGGEDSTDSEHERDSDAASDHEQDGVLFDDDADSTFGEEEGIASGSDESSDLTDSEEGDESDDDSNKDSNGNEEDEDEDSEESVDSGAESAGLTASSDEADKAQQKRKQTQGKGKKVTHSELDNKKQKGGGEIQKQQVKESKEQKGKGKELKEQKSSVDRLSDKMQGTSVAIKPVEEKDEYESGDTSDEEDRRNPAGDVPMWWYDEYPHLGYDLDGRRILRPPQRDRIDEFLRKCEDPEFWRTVRDPATGQDVRLSKDDLQLIQRIREGKVPNAQHDEYEPWLEWFSREVLATPVRAFPEHKRSFLPSRSDQRQVSKIVHALKMGWTKTRKEIARERQKRKEKVFYNLWGSAADEERVRGIHKHIPAPKRALPSHAESYNPPPEYLLDDKEMKEWNELSETPWKRKHSFLPTRHAGLRAVPAHARFVRERFLRCLDLYLAPRALKMRLTISPEDLVPKLPSPRELQPFPTAETLVFRGHEGLVRGAGFDPSGQYVVSGGDDGTVKVWETSTGRCLRTMQVNAPLSDGGGGGGVCAVQWTPARGLSLLAAAAGARLLLLNPGAGVGAHRVAERTDRLLEEPPPHKLTMDERTSSCVQWETVSSTEWARGVRLAITHFKPVTHVSWHARGDYVCVTLRDGASRSVAVHQLSRRASQLPFSRARGLVQCALFHPTKPLIFVATQRVVRVYDLVKQELVRKLQTGAQWVSALAAHPGGDNLLVASFDRKVLWFDLELSARPYQTLRLHGRAVRAVAFHARYPLFATAGDDPYLVVSHGQVYSDLLQNPLLVPLKQLPAGAARGGVRVLALSWHPAQPWLLAAGADGLLRLYT